ncbi:RNA-processing protein [Candidatus Woesearchaeota archaeon]|jgi:ribosomal RNA assembly protein|nr:RNA-processing protein [Candidatus Woesearchaeota archaeon]MDP6648484.1 KH domain-containing protein [Candidatus Woesearchaeota archaeon]|tara:strand:+ start:3163 stop:3708 length:546 start_codon:yes stop_codon:yes gene_type:complete
MVEYSYELKVPKSRVAVIIGKEGSVKKDLEESTKTKLEIDSKEGDVFVSGEDALGLYTAREIIKAIGRGFNPDIAKLLLKPDYIFEVVDLKEFIGKSKDAMLRLKGRVIGKEGKSRRLIEELTECDISVFGRTIGIIGDPESAASARQAVESLLRGSNHSTVYKWLERRRREMKRKAIMNM